MSLLALARVPHTPLSASDCLTVSPPVPSLPLCLLWMCVWASRWACKCKHERLPEVVWFTSKEMTQHAHNEQNQQQNQHGKPKSSGTGTGTRSRSRSPGIQGTEPADPCCACLFYSLYSVIWEVAPLELLLLFHCRDKQWVEQETSCSSCHWQAGGQKELAGIGILYILYFYRAQEIALPVLLTIQSDIPHSE